MNKLIVVVISVLVILGVMRESVVWFLFVRVRKECIIFYIVLNKLMYGLVDFMVVKKGKCIFSFCCLCNKVICIDFLVFVIIDLVLLVEFFFKWVNFLNLV